MKDTWIQLNLVAVLTDIHGFEEITRIIISEVPEGVFLSPGTDNGDGTWSVSLGELPLVCILPPEDFGDDIKMTVSITSREDNAGDAAASQDFTIHRARRGRCPRGCRRTCHG